MASPRGACLPGRFPDTIPPSTKGYQCCVSGAVASICIFNKLSVDFLRTEGGGCYSWLSWQVHGRIRRGDREKLTSSTPGGAASPQALPSGLVRTGGEWGAASTRTPESVSPCSACSPWGAHPIWFTSWLTPTVPHDGWVQTLLLSDPLTHPP